MIEEEAPAQGFNSNKINEIPPERLAFPQRYSRESFAAPEGATVPEIERTAEGYLEIEWQYQEVQRALNLDFNNFAATSYSREDLEKAAQPHIAEMNERRGQYDADPLDIATVNDAFLRQVIRPVWQKHIPEGDDEKEEVDWEKFKQQFPEHMQINLEELRDLDGKMRVLSNDEKLQTEVQSIHAEKIKVMRAASAFMAGDRKAEALGRRVSEIYRAAAMSNRLLTKAETRHIEHLQEQQIRVRESRGRLIESPAMLGDVRTELHRRIDIKRRREFERGLVMTGQMQEVIDEFLPSISQGKPALAVGETGGAKTALMEYISREYLGKEPEFLAGNEELNVYQAFGKTRITSEDGLHDYYDYGPVLRAMTEGKPLIVDEVNANRPEFLKRFNQILRLRPGDTYRPQEDGGEAVVVQPGFVILATANEKSVRYKGVEDLSVELLNRFGPNVARVQYPDHDVVFGQTPVENAIIAKAALTDRAGNMVPVVSQEEFERYVRAAHVSQQVFSGNFGEGYQDFRTAEQIADRKPGLEEAVLAPRTMVDILEKVRDSYGKVTLEQALRRFVMGIKKPSDRQQMINILQGQDFLKPDDGSDGTLPGGPTNNPGS